MLDRADIALLSAIVLTIALFHFFYTARILRKHDAAAKKYRLCAVRDRLVGLVVEGKVKEDSPAFQRLYKATNSLVSRPEYLNLRTFVGAVQNVTDKGLTPLFEDELDARNKALAEEAVAFCDAVLSILWDNSFILRMMVRIRRRLPRKKGGPHLPPVQRQAYKLYRDYSKASSRLSAAAA